MIISRISAAGACLVSGLLLASCGSGTPEPDGTTTVVASFHPIAWAAREVGGSDVTVTDITPAGVEPHDVELTPKDVAKIKSADVVFYIGQGFQPAVEDALENAPGVRAIDLLDTPGLELLDEADGGGVDPHVWLDPTRYQLLVTRIGEELGAPQGAADLNDQLGSLDGEMEAGLATCDRRDIVTAHTAFGYLADRFDLVQHGIAGLSPEAEPTPRDLADAIAIVRETEATTVFFEPLAPPSTAKAVARAAGVETSVLDPIEGLSTDAVERGDDYLSVQRENLANLQVALGCTT